MAAKRAAMKENNMGKLLAAIFKSFGAEMIEFKTKEGKNVRETEWRRHEW